MRKNRIGEKNIASNGQFMEIINYTRNDNIDVKFDDGTIVVNKSYQAFYKGKIKNPNCKKGHNRVGETNKSNNGQIMQIIKYNNYGDIVVKFEDGTVVYNINYGNFVRGNVKNPNFNTKKEIELKRLGEIGIATNQQKMEIIKYNGIKDICVRFEDGTEIEHQSYGAFKNGLIINPNKKTNNAISLNEFVLHFYLKDYGFYHAKSGSLKQAGLGMLELDLYNPKIKVGIEYDGYGHLLNKDLKKNQVCKSAGITLYRIREPLLKEFNDNISYNFYLTSSRHFSLDYQNTIIKLVSKLNKSHRLKINNDINFKRDKYIIKNMFYEEYCAIKSRLGEKRVANNGQLMEIVSYRGCMDIDVRFEDGTIVKNKQYTSFVSGGILNPSYSNRDNRLGETNISINGQSMEIINYVNNHDINVLFEDGTVVTHTWYSSFKKGTLKNPNYDYKRKYIGMKNIAKNGMSMEIIRYRSSVDIDVKFDDGVIVKHRRMDHFRDGYIKK